MVGVHVGLFVWASGYGSQIEKIAEAGPWINKSFKTPSSFRRAVHAGQVQGAVVWADEEGLEIIKELVESNPGLAILAVTDDESAHIERAREVVGRLGHVAWPILASELVPRLEVRVERSCLAREVTELRKRVAAGERALHSTSSTLETATERLVTAEELAAVGRVVTGIAHEIASQLALVGYAEAIKSRVADDPELCEFADIIINAQRRLSAMVDEIRDFATAHGHGDRDAHSFELQPAEVGALVDEALSLMSYDRAVRARNLVTDYRERALARVDRKRFSQVVMNLVSNAVLATEDGGDIRVGLNVEGGEAVLAVADSGEGMPSEVVSRLGEIFFTTRGDRGSGLGVGICKRIVEEHGGSLSYTSEVGKGTTATVRLPLLEARGSAGEGPRKGRTGATEVEEAGAGVGDDAGGSGND